MTFPDMMYNIWYNQTERGASTCGGIRYSMVLVLFHLVHCPFVVVGSVAFNGALTVNGMANALARSVLGSNVAYGQFCVTVWRLLHCVHFICGVYCADVTQIPLPEVRFIAFTTESANLSMSALCLTVFVCLGFSSIKSSSPLFLLRRSICPCLSTGPRSSCVQSVIKLCCVV